MKNKFYKTWWFWLIVIVILVVTLLMMLKDRNEQKETSKDTNTTISPSVTNEYEDLDILHEVHEKELNERLERSEELMQKSNKKMNENSKTVIEE